MAAAISAKRLFNEERRCRRSRAGVSAAGVSGAAELHQIKIRRERIVSRGQPPSNTRLKRKSPARPGFFDEYLFQSVHFASLAI